MGNTMAFVETESKVMTNQGLEGSRVGLLEVGGSDEESGVEQALQEGRVEGPTFRVSMDGVVGKLDRPVDGHVKCPMEPEAVT